MRSRLCPTSGPLQGRCIALHGPGGDMISPALSHCISIRVCREPEPDLYDGSTLPFLALALGVMNVPSNHWEDCIRAISFINPPLGTACLDVLSIFPGGSGPNVFCSSWRLITIIFSILYCCGSLQCQPWLQPASQPAHSRRL